MADDSILRRLRDLESRVADLETLEYSKWYFEVLSHTTGDAWSTISSRSSADDGEIDLSATFGIPDNITAVIVRVDMNDGDAGAPVALCSMGPTASPTEALFYADPAYNGEWMIHWAIVTCNASGNIHISFSETVDNFRFFVLGYII